MREDGEMAAKYPHVSALIKAAMDAQRVTAPQLAAALGVSDPTVYRWRSGDSTPDESLWPTIESLLAIRLSKAPETVADWRSEMAELRANVAQLADRVAALEADRPAPRLRAAQGPTGAHRTATSRPARRPAPPAADPDDHTI